MASHSIPPDLLDAILNSPNVWGVKADDKIKGERLSQAFVKKLVTDYISAPNDPALLRNLGLLAMFLGVAQWGISDPEGLPNDPARKHWQAVTGTDSGKHLMSYSVGGIGITHADVGLLAEFIVEVVNQNYVPQDHKPALLRLADSNLYGGHEVKYDQIRCAALCVKEDFSVDLLGEPFDHFHTTADENWCQKYNRSKFKPHDWLVFKTWMRAALRDRSMQDWLISRWLDTDWKATTNKIPKGDGYAEEALVNVRVRNSSPKLADLAVTLHASTTAQRIQRELDTYKKHQKGAALERRCWLMQRPVVLFRHFAGLEQLQGITCPPESA